MPNPYIPNFTKFSLTASTALQDYHSGQLLTLDAAAGLTVTLPAATGSGARYYIAVGTTVTSNGYIIRVASSSDVMAGSLAIASDIGGVSVPTTSTSDTITMSGTTTGGIVGSFVELTDMASGKWLVSGSLVSSGTEATPFSAAV